MRCDSLFRFRLVCLLLALALTWGAWCLAHRAASAARPTGAPGEASLVESTLVEAPRYQTASSPVPVCGWHMVPYPKDDLSHLQDIVALSPTDLWAVGSVYDGTTSRTLTLHGNGALWRPVPSPNHGTGRNTLNAVAAASADDVWAAGEYRDDALHSDQTLMVHWDGRTWRVVPSPNPGADHSLEGVAALSAHAAWAVGYYSYEGRSQTLTLHWDGHTWSVIPSPNVGDEGNYLHAVATVAADDVWAVGWYAIDNERRGLILHWDGSAWGVVPGPNPFPEPSIGALEIYDVSAISADDVWAVGWYQVCGSDGPLIVHWDRTNWRMIPVPGSGALRGVAAVAANDVWAVGEYSVRYNHVTRSQALILHWNGTMWQTLASPDPGTSNWLYSVASSSARSTWAVGTFLEGYVPPPCVTPTAMPTFTPTPTHTPSVTPTPSYTPSPTPEGMPTYTPTPTASPTPTSMPGPPSYLRPEDGAVIPQPVSPEGWHFSWSARDGPCYSMISVRGPGNRCLSDGYVPYPYEYRYQSSHFLPDDALGPWVWSVAVLCPLGSNQSEQYIFWVEPARRAFVPFVLK
ncbi:MAG: hypothetical protein JXA93_12835 [Anaerolineae bacterium]|nr:hypothetical protein [Anaerolineae bacterium]